MDTRTITTPGGYQVTIRTALTYGQDREVQRLLMGDQSFEVKPGQKVDGKDIKLSLSMSNLYASQDKTMAFLVQEVRDTDGSEFEDPYRAVLDLPAVDGQAVRDAIDEVTSPKASPKTST